MLKQAQIQISWQLVDSPETYAAAITALQNTSGPIAIDTERASGYTYFQNAYLVQVKRGNGENFLFDPVALTNFSELAAVINPELWILHSGKQDLDCLAKLGLIPSKLWDTELAARMLGAERVGLGALVADILSVELEKKYSNVNWSLRPLNKEWLEYAALDVEFLERLMQEQQLLAAAQKKEKALAQEFTAIINRKPKTPITEPWRRVSQINTVARDNRALAIVRELWLARDNIARAKNLAPHRVLPDSAIIAAATKQPRSIETLKKIDGFQGAQRLTQTSRFWRAIVKGKLVEENLRRLPQPDEGEFSSLIFRKNAAAKNRLIAGRAALKQAAKEFSIPAEQLLDPAILKRIAADPPTNISVEAVAEKLTTLGAREWQVSAISQYLADVFVDNL